MPSPRPSESLLRSDHRQNAPIAATMLAIITGTNSRRSSSVGIRLALHRFKDSSLPEEISKQLRICHPTLIRLPTHQSPRPAIACDGDDPDLRRDLRAGIGGAFPTPDTCKMGSARRFRYWEGPVAPRRGFKDRACLSRCPVERQGLPDRGWRDHFVLIRE
jgi:hypothetical protein